MSTNTAHLDSTPPNNARPADAAAALVCAELELPPPTPEHEWLLRFVGNWDAQIEMLGAPEQPPMKTRGTETARMVGGYWLVSDGRNNEFPYAFRLTLGFDPKRRIYIGTWIDSMTSFLWHYEGAVDPTGRILSLETEGPFPPIPGTISRYREVTEFLSESHRVFTSARLGEDGNWTTHMRINFWKMPAG